MTTIEQFADQCRDALKGRSVTEGGQAVCKLTFERMLEEPLELYGTDIGSSYQQQEETLSRYFMRT